MVKVGVLTISNRASQGVYSDESGPLAVELLKGVLGLDEAKLDVVPDDETLIKKRLIEWCDIDGCNLIFTNGGTGISPTDVTPQATMSVIGYQVPGLAELMRSRSLEETPMAALSRALAGVRGRTLIINLPGSPRGVRTCLQALLPVLPHALEQLESGGGHRRV